MGLSTQFKFALVLLGTLAALAIGSAFLITFGVEKALSEKMKESGENAVYLSSIIIQDKYRGLLFLKVEQALQVKGTLTLYERVVRSLAEDEDRDDFLEDLENLPFPDNLTLWTVDDSLRTRRIGGDMRPGFDPYSGEDVKGRKVGENMLRLTKQNTTAATLVSADPPPGNDRQYFGVHFYLPSMKLMIGLWTDLQPSYAVQEARFKEAVRSMQDHLETVDIGVSGFLVVADASGKLIIHSPDFPEDGVLRQRNPLTDNTLIADIRRASADPSVPVRALLATPAGFREALIYTKYSRAFDWYVAGICFSDEIAAPGRKLSMYLIAGMLATAALLAPASLYLLNKLTAPLARLSEFARKLPETDFLKEREEADRADVAALARNRGGDEIGELANAFLFMDGALRDRVRELVETAGSRERMVGELQAAADIQSGILPKPLPEKAVGGRFALAASLKPAREVGGDLYDFFMLDDERICMIVGDVSDKGVPAALFMSMAMVLIRSGAQGAGGPEQIMKKVNETLARENPGCMFVTLFIAFLNVNDGELIYASAGHNPPMIRSGGTIRELDGWSGPVVGGFENADYERFADRMLPGDILFMYTDGLTEAMNGGRELFGVDALQRTLAGCPSDSPGEIIEYVHNAVERHVNGAPVSDDLTILCLRKNR